MGFESHRKGFCMNNVSFSGIKFMDEQSREDFTLYLKSKDAAAQKTIMDNFKKMDDACGNVDLYLKSSALDHTGFFLYGDKEMSPEEHVAGNIFTEYKEFDEFASTALEKIPGYLALKKFLAEHM